MSDTTSRPAGADAVPGQLAAVVPEQPRRSMRRMLALLGSQKSSGAAALDPLFAAMRRHHQKVDSALIERAYRTSEQYHDGQLRKSGDAYITHPLAVATILASLGLNEPTICAALLHDTVEDTGYTLAQLTHDFGEEIATMVDGVTKLDKVVYGESAKAETIRKMVIAMSRDIRVLIIKLADRLHNMRTISSLRQDKQIRIAKDTLEIYAPLAHRLGMNAIKWELEDLSFSVIEPKIYSEIVKLVADRAPLRDQYLTTVIEQVKQDLAENKIKATVYGRPKHYYSIYQKMMVRGRDFYDIYDLVGLRVLVDTKRECYDVLGVLHARWKPLPGRFKDYIAMPKFNLYQSLHTTVLGPGGKPVELQIRTHEMHKQAEYGVAAHWRYKEGKSAGDEINWVHSISEWQKETEDSGEFLDTFTEEIAKNEVFVFSPKGDVIALPAGSTPVDFAYAIHTEVGHRCIGARVNGRLVPLDSTLEMGMSIDIITSKAQNAGPSRDWLNFVKTPRARAKIRQYFSRERRDEAIEQGKELLAKQMRRSHLAARLLTPEVMAHLTEHFHVSDVPSLWAALGEGSIGAQAVITQLVSVIGGDEAAAEASLIDEALLVRGAHHKLPRNHSGVVVDGDPDLYTKLAKCCMPVPGDPIIGFVTRGEGISVHRTDCTNVASLRQMPERIVPVSWAPTADAAFLVAVQVEGIDRAGMLNDLTRVLSEMHMSIVSVSANASKDHVFTMRLTFQTPDPRHLETVLRGLQRVSGVYEVSRVKPG
ncbi:bifunctional (p)ppGpp synthetase/guanosine-3',5'-bis(diphosphate) 3'-pyrophosphohydrolase [Propioniciclava flava]|uniref:Bifunctional (P)ppGpp synthetase/guanosine-3',5'-bis(Diphosphate) 3'-pyrophosphohydrolase n=2 Tax=Propioniciclava flava TaxID=2072026 RepID=A0A4Q2EK34_9ACTN|nr:bifunctional (p)ppGpp synthetase/guanosine-3',5'-bis(diphosphate) 3'-pyrophosphohydrolase [Propioniciclava flava]